MWYENSYRRHLCDMHTDDWDESFLSEFSPKDYLENLKKTKINNAMIYFQSHVGLCYYPTKSGKIHNAFVGREDMMKQLVDMCRENGISVTGYYSLIYNNWAKKTHPEWGIVMPDKENNLELAFASDKSRYGLCCPNNNGYREFVFKQIKEMMEYFNVDGMFFDMLFWPALCNCDACRKKFKDETGYALPQKEDWNDPLWLLHISKRREWMGQFARTVTDKVKSYNKNISVEHNVAFAALPDAKTALGEEVLDACDYAGGDLYGNEYTQSFVCKFYKNVTKNQPFEYMFSRCEPGLTKHTVTKSLDTMLSAAFLTAAHHGATLVIDAIDPKGTLDGRVYERIGKVFEKTSRYEKYFNGKMIEDVGIYYTMRSKFNAHNEGYSNHRSCVNITETLIKSNISCGITGGYHDISEYKLLIAPCLTEEDAYDFERIKNYVRNGGKLYLSGGDCHELLREFFGAKTDRRTEESVVYIAPVPKYGKTFGWFNESYPLHFDGSAPVINGIDEKNILAYITLPYTVQNTPNFASIHSDPPGIKTKIPAIASAKYGKGSVLWSALNIESVNASYQYGEIFIDLIKDILNLNQSIMSDAPDDVEITAFESEDNITVSAVQYCTGKTARYIEPFYVEIVTDKQPKKILNLPDETECEFEYSDGKIRYTINNLKIFDMKKIIK